ncbi:PepSY domain-containing protein [Marivivens marinus]|uniref:PepSY domain-containing protein n=1 Tax=Marivivens marinus TaxID=3110173 RepID=UPI003B84A14C
MKKLILALALIVPANFALASGAEPVLTDEIRTQITELMVADGYEVRQIKTEDGYFEVYALKDGEQFELFLDADFNIVDRADND